MISPAKSRFAKSALRHYPELGHFLQLDVAFSVSPRLARMRTLTLRKSVLVPTLAFHELGGGLEVFDEGAVLAFLVHVFDAQ